MLSKKITVQKSFRIEARMESDLEILAGKLNRPQNELVNAALNQLIIENMGWFTEDYLIILCNDFLDKKISEIEIRITGLYLHMIDTGNEINMDYDIVTEEYEKYCSNGIFVNDETGYTLITNILKTLALQIDTKSPEIQNYLHNRFEYIYSRQKSISEFDRSKFVKQSIGEIPPDVEYNDLTTVFVSKTKNKLKEE